MDLKETEIRDYSLIGKESGTAVKNGLADAEWYTSPVPKEKMNELLVRKNDPAIRDTLLWFGLIGCSGYLVYYFWGSWLAVLPYIVYSVLYASTSDSRWHESGHGTAFKTNWMNNVLYEVASFMVLRQSTVWRYSHTRHHSDTIIRGRDPEIAVARPADILKVLLIFVGISSSIPEFKKLFKHASGKIDPQVATFLPKKEYKTVFFKARAYLLIFASVIALSIYFKSILPFMYIGLPTLLGSWLMPVYGLTQHAGLAENVLDHRLNSRTVLMNRAHRYLYWNMNYHIEHHMFPLVPYHALPKLHELIKHDCPAPYKSITETYREIIPAILKQAKDPSYFVKRELPATANKVMVKSDEKYILNAGNITENKLKICNASEIAPGEVKRFDFDNKTYALYRTKEDKLYATDGYCTHGNAHLANGMIIGGQIECSKHNGRFNLDDGSAARPPVCVGINTYPVETARGTYFIDVNKLTGKGPAGQIIKCAVVSNHNVTPFIKELVLKPENNWAFDFKAGQYAHLLIPPHETYPVDFEIDGPYKKYWDHLSFKSINKINTNRNYSFVNNPDDKTEIIFNVRIALPPDGTPFDAGLGSSYVFRLKQGDLVELTGPYGDFTIKGLEKEMVYIGGGAGMAPIKSHISYLLESLKTKRKITYWFGARNMSEIYYAGYFRELEKNHPDFNFNIALSQPQPGDKWDGYTGNVPNVLFDKYLQNHHNPKDIEFYVCGPPAMVKACIEILKRLDIGDEMIAYDEF